MANMEQIFKSVLDQDTAPVVLCDLNHTVVYMNETAKKRYRNQGGDNLLGNSVMRCHPPYARKLIEKVLDWFRQDVTHNIVYTYRNDQENKDVYMVALRDDSGELIGYYEKHEYRNCENGKLYEMA